MLEQKTKNAFYLQFDGARGKNDKKSEYFFRKSAMEHSSAGKSEDQLEIVASC